MAQARSILARRPRGSTSVASIHDFVLGRGREVSLRDHFLAAPEAVSPYALDAERRLVGLVRTREGVDPAEAHPFFYAAQRANAVELVTASFDEVHALADDLGNLSMRLAFLYSAGRSGSTVAGKMASRLPGVQSLSEPDVFAHVAMARRRADVEGDAELALVARSTARLLVAHRAAVDPSRRVVLVKQRGMGVFGAELVHGALPEARALFLVRDVADVVDSYVGAFLDNPLIAFGRRVGLDRLGARLVRVAVPYTHPWIARSMPGVVAGAPGRSDGAVEILALAVQAMNAEVARIAGSGTVRFAPTLRYEALRADARGFARELADALGLARSAGFDAALDAAVDAARGDAQAGSSVASRGRRSLSEQDVVRVADALAARNPRPSMVSSEAA